MPSRIRLVHWHPAEAIERAARLRSMGFVVDAEPLGDGASMKALRSEPPDAIVIDLSRLPSHGRTLAFVLRNSKSTRGIPLVFVEGEGGKLKRVRDMLPDAMYTTWAKIEKDIRKAIANPPREPIVPKSTSGGYSGTPLPKKFGIKESSTIGFIGAPKDFEKTLGQLPAGAKIIREPRIKCDVILCFAVMKKELMPRMKKAMKLSADSGLWLIWPKKSSGVPSDLSEDVVRNAGLGAGWVDFKVAAIDATWSGHKFAKRDRVRKK
ncbi:MAG: response regulator [Anaerolineae bacterium]|nr:response regulator [Phycisphaerae bacterium]